MSTNQKWEALETAEAVVAAVEAGRRVGLQHKAGGWKHTRIRVAYWIDHLMKHGWEYRALVKGGEP